MTLLLYEFLFHDRVLHTSYTSVFCYLLTFLLVSSLGKILKRVNLIFNFSNKTKLMRLYYHLSQATSHVINIMINV
jgi:hypothetical protein